MWRGRADPWISFISSFNVGMLSGKKAGEGAVVCACKGWLKIGELRLKLSIVFASSYHSPLTHSYQSLSSKKSVRGIYDSTGVPKLPPATRLGLNARRNG